MLLNGIKSNIFIPTEQHCGNNDSEWIYIVYIRTRIQCMSICFTGVLSEWVTGTGI
jgi:hypothetical protein